MIQITPHMRILVAIEPADFRKGIDGISQLCRERLQSDPFSGALFIFRNRRRTAIKILVYDGQGYWVLHKRLSKGRFAWWPRQNGASGVRMKAHELQVLICAGNPSATCAAPEWRKVIE